MSTDERKESKKQFGQEEYKKVHRLVYEYQAGSQEAAKELIESFSKFFTKYIALIKFGTYDLSHYSTRSFIKLFVHDSKDKKLIVCEEDVLIRIQNQKDALSDMTYEELSFLSFYHIPLLEEVLEITKNVPIILKLKIKKNEKLFELLDKYEGKFAIISTNSKIINWVNKNRESYIIGEVETKRKVFNLNFYFVKSDFKSYNIEYIDKVKLKKMRENSIVLGYLINNKTKLKMYNNLFDSLIIDNYFGITKK